MSAIVERFDMAEIFACEIMECPKMGDIIVADANGEHYFCWQHYDEWAKQEPAEAPQEDHIEIPFE